MEKDEVSRADLLGEALGTTYQVSYYPDKNSMVGPAIDSVFKAINRSMSTYLPDSDISRINRGDSTVRVDEMFRDVFALSKEIHRRTEGYFDPTVGVLTDAWGFGPGEAMELDSVRVDSLLTLVGFQKVSLDEKNRIWKNHPGIQFDFNAIAKGYAVDRLALMLERYGIENYLVEVGGEVRATGQNLEKQAAWTVGVDKPITTGERELAAVVELKDKSLASSGNYRKFRIDSVSGEKYVHTIDPRTGYTKNSNILAASVLAPTCAMADGYATAFMAMPLEESRALLDGDSDLEAMIIYTDNSGAIYEWLSPGFKKVRLR